MLHENPTKRPNIFQHIHQHLLASSNREALIATFTIYLSIPVFNSRDLHILASIMAVQTRSKNFLLNLSLCLYGSLFLISLSAIAVAMVSFPLFHFQTMSLSWSHAWLVVALIDRFAILFCICGVIITSEDSWRWSVFWTISCCIFGGPACCLYIFLCLTKQGNMRLERYEKSQSTIKVVAAENHDDTRKVSKRESRYYGKENNYDIERQKGAVLS